MLFHDFAITLQQLEKTDSRNAKTKTLAQLFAAAGPEDIGYIAYLLQGRVAPLFEPVEFGVAQKFMIRAISIGTSVDQSAATRMFKKTGDLGTTAEKIKNQQSKHKKSRHPPDVTEVFAKLLKIAQTAGAGSQEEKIRLLSQLIADADALSTRYIVRIPLNKLRLGFSDMTMLDGLSWMLAGDKSKRADLERAYNVRPDLAYLVTEVKKRRLEQIAHVTPTPGTPILMARANRLNSAAAILQKIGECAVEYKYDGLRLQVHVRKPKTKNQKPKADIRMFSRNLEDVTDSFPDIAQAVLKQINADSVILEGEVVAYNPKTGVYMPFQHTMQRKRKHDIAQKTVEIPVKLFAFELLYAEGKSFLDYPYEARKEKLKSLINQGDTIIYAQETMVSSQQQIEQLFAESMAQHFEGIIAKKRDGRYEAGMRGWSWIKFKHAQSKKLADTLDVLVMGYTRGQGRRAGFGVGQFLTGVYDSRKQRFVTISKIGTGLTDKQFGEFKKRVKDLETQKKPAEYALDKLLEPDIWLRPGLVVEVGSDEITRSSVHTAGRILGRSKSGKAMTVTAAGYALRFPRLVRFRDDKRASDATTLSEIVQMYKKQQT